MADEFDVQVAIHTDTLNEAGFVDDTIAAIGGRTIHTYHTEGAGGGHAPDIIKIAGLPNILPSSTNPTRPLTVNTIAEHLDMLMVCHHLNPQVPEDVAFAESRIRQETIAAEDILHDLGVISMMSSDSQAMGRIGEVVTRTWQTAHKMKVQRGPLAGDSSRQRQPRASNATSPSTPSIRPSRTASRSEVGSIEPGKLADLVLWSPAFFGVKPEMVIKGGFIAWSVMGDANASIPTPQPVLYRPMFGSFGARHQSTGVTFVSLASLPNVEKLGSAQAAGARPELPEDRKGGHDPQLRDAQNRSGSGNLRSSRRRRAAHLRAGQRSAAGAALFSFLIMSHNHNDRAFRIGVAGPVGSGKTALVHVLSQSLWPAVNLAVVTNDIYTREDAEFLIRQGDLPAERVTGVETGGCPHSAIREDASMNLEAIEELERAHPGLELVFIESGGDNLAAAFSPELVDVVDLRDRRGGRR